MTAEVELSARGRVCRRAGAVAVAALLAAGVSGLTAGCSQPNQDSIPSELAGFQPVCASDPGAIFPQAPPYHGPGPHAIVVFVSYDQAGVTNIPELGSAEMGGLPWGSNLPASTQLAACVDRVSSASRPVSACTYRQQSQTLIQQPIGPALHLKMYRATYQVTLREIRTRRVIATARLAGEDTTCPPSVGLDAVGSSSVYSWPTAGQWQRAIGRYVAGHA